MENISYEENEKRKLQYVDKIISVISPILIGLAHDQIAIVLEKTTQRILKGMIFTGKFYEKDNPRLYQEKADQRENEATQ